MVAYWTAYRHLTDAAFAQIDVPKLAIDTTDGDWPAYQRQVLAFLDLPPVLEHPPCSNPARFVGTYRHTEGDTTGFVVVTREGGDLYLDGAPHVWPRTRLLPTADNAFDVESMPFTLTFEAHDDGATDRMIATGPELFSGRLPRLFVKEPG
jgi:hypothetical protein